MWQKLILPVRFFIPTWSVIVQLFWSKRWFLIFLLMSIACLWGFAGLKVAFCVYECVYECVYWYKDKCSPNSVMAISNSGCDNVAFVAEIGHRLAQIFPSVRSQLLWWLNVFFLGGRGAGQSSLHATWDFQCLEGLLLSLCKRSVSVTVFTIITLIT